MEYPLTNIHPDAKIGEGVQIESFSSIYENTEIGDGTWIGPNVTIMPGARIGKDCKIYPGAVISADPQDLKFEGEETLTYIGDGSVIREYVTVNKGTNDRNKTAVGKNCLLMAYVHIAHDCIIGDNCILANSVQVAGHVVMGDYAIIGGTSGVHQFVHIGKHCIVAGGSTVLQDVPPYSKAGRSPLSYHGLNLIGLRRRGFPAEKIDRIKNMYSKLYSEGLNLTMAINDIEEGFPASEERDTIIEFVRSSERGLIRGYRPGAGKREAE